MKHVNSVSYSIQTRIYFLFFSLVKHKIKRVNDDTMSWISSGRSCSFVSSIGTMLPMFLVLAFIYTACQTIKGLVLEKERRLKEVLRVVGVQNSSMWFCWFIENMVLMTIPCALISLMVKVSGAETLKNKKMEMRTE